MYYRNTREILNRIESAGGGQLGLKQQAIKAPERLGQPQMASIDLANDGIGDEKPVPLTWAFSGQWAVQIVMGRLRQVFRYPDLSPIS
jgi:hypothetical protein